MISNSAVTTSISLLVLLTLFSRLLLLAVLPDGAYSNDFANYLNIIRVLETGGNPYIETRHLNYGPLWLQVLWGMKRGADFCGVSPARALQFFNVLSETFLVIGVYGTCVLFTTRQRAFLITLCGLVLNPVCMILTCIHGSFDALLAALMVFSLWSLILFLREPKLGSWFECCFILGWGILCKTVPVVLLPLLLLGRRILNFRELALGYLIALAPMMVGLSTIYVLARTAVKQNVLTYASVPGYFGFTGLFRVFGLGQSWDHFYINLFRVVLLAMLVGVGLIASLRVKPRESDPIRLSTLILLFIVTFGPGFGPQYFFWIIPLLCLQLAIFEKIDPWVRAHIAIIIVCGVVSAVTYIYEYYSYPGLSGTLAMGKSGLADYRAVQIESTLLRLPIFATLLIVFAFQLASTARATFSKG